MFRTGTIFLAALLYIGFIWLKSQYPHLEDVPLWLAVGGCLVGAFLLRIPTGARQGTPPAVEAQKEQQQTEPVAGESANKVDPAPIATPVISDSAYVRLMARTHSDIGYGFMLMHLHLIPQHACDVPLEKFLDYYQAWQGTIEAARKLRLFDDDEYLVAVFIDAFVFTSKSVYVLGEHAFAVEVSGIAHHAFKSKIGKDEWQFTMTNGDILNFVVKWSVTNSIEFEKTLTDVREKAYEGLKAKTIERREHLRKLRSGQ